MKSDIFTNLKAPSWVLPMKLISEGGITWIIPEEDEFDRARDKGECLWENLISMSKPLTISFLELGKLLYESITIESYKPVFYDDAITDRLQKNGEGFHSSLHDDECPFLCGNHRNAVLSAILDFVNEYGMIRNNDSHAGEVAAQVVIGHLSKQLFGNKLWQYKAPLSWVAYCIFETYLMCVKPDEYELLKAKHPARYIHTAGPPVVSTQISIELNSKYQQGHWREEKIIDSVLGLVVLMLQYNEDIIIRICPNCGACFVTSNEKAIYCSPVCRNRANAKKSYNRKKAGDPHA